MTNALFPNFTQMRSIVPRWFWWGIRAITIVLFLGLITVLFTSPETGLMLLWKLIVPLLPFMIFISLGFWRNICPLAAIHQVPRAFGFSKSFDMPDSIKKTAYPVSIILFFILVPGRHLALNHSGILTATVLVGVISAAFILGFFFKGKGGWCGTFCPMNPIERLYGQSPFIEVKNSHCEPCVGCKKNCFDFNPSVAYLADLHDPEENYRNLRKLFAGALPGLIFAFYTVPPVSLLQEVLHSGHILAGLKYYGTLLSYILTSSASLLILQSALHIRANYLTLLYACIALNLYYWFNIPTLSETFHTLTGNLISSPLQNGIHLAVLAISILWFYRGVQKEKLFLQEINTPKPTKVGSTRALKRHQEKQSKLPTITLLPSKEQVVAQSGKSILDILEGHSCNIKVGCKAGMCGADPIYITEGMDNLSPISPEEQSTLKRISQSPNARLACKARISGNVSLSLTETEVADKPQKQSSAPTLGFTPDSAVNNIVVIGNGIAGVTACETAREISPTAKITLISKEEHPLYNRMAISKLVYNKQAMQDLYLLPGSWYQDQSIDCRLNTLATKINREKKIVQLGTSEQINYDKLILTMGSRSSVPPIEHFGLPGSFVLRNACDGMDIRAYSQNHACKSCVIAGGGLLGLEAAYALYKLGLKVTVLERSDRLLRRQLDDTASDILRHYLTNLGITLKFNTECSGLQENNARLDAVTLKDNSQIDADIFLVCAGIKPATELASNSGLNTGEGIRVNERMQTSDPDIYAAGDLAEFDSQIFGLWTVAVGQAQVAARNAFGAKQGFTHITPETTLKVSGIDIFSSGQFNANPEMSDESEIIVSDENHMTYKKIVCKDNKIIGGILVGHPTLSTSLSEAVKNRVDLSADLTAFQAGDWKALQ